MAILPDNVTIELSSRSEEIPDMVDENFSPRGYKPVLVFNRFEVRSENRMITASRVHGQNVDKIRQFWTKAEVDSGDWVILEGNGNIVVMTDKEFLGLLAK